MHAHGWSLQEIEDVTPFERAIYHQLLVDELKKKAQEKEQARYERRG